MEIIFATGNQHKVVEAQKALGDSFALIMPKELGITEDIPETGDTLEDNAKEKSLYLWEKLGRPCFADDTGLEVEELGGEPGVYSARYAGEECSSEANMKKLLHNLEGKDNRKAQFRTAICLIMDNEQHLFEGICRGEIIKEKRGGAGFGYDPIFVPEGYTETFAELGNDIKNTISHRAKAVQMLCEFLNK